jgi:hypothetical protein
MELREAGELLAWSRKTGQVIARGPHIWLVRVFAPALTRLPKYPAFRLALSV